VKPIQNTIFGGHGFIGSHLCQSFEKDGFPYQIVGRQDPLPKGDLGNVFYCAGVTADFRSRPFATIDAHISTLARVLEGSQFSTFIYFSSARLYRHSSITSEESRFTVTPLEMEDFVDISKLAGEALCHSTNNKNVRIVRLSNVFGKDYLSKNFLTELIESALIRNKIHLRSALASSKDYLDIESAIKVIRRISECGKYRLYNVASGYNISHEKIVCLIKELTGCLVTVEEGASAIKWPLINNDRITQEFDFKPLNLMDALEDLVAEYKNILHKE
jgi:nucleoside-diphosphate-sugar epimerase